MSAEEVQALGPALASRMSTEQLEAASLMFNSIATATTEHNLNTIMGVRRVFTNHLKSCIRMPAGGAGAGGSQQTGFEMELITSDAASNIFASWPNKEVHHGGKSMSWELRSMEDLAAKLALEDSPAGWGAMQGKPIAIPAGRTHHTGVILAGPPFTVCWVMRADETTLLTVRFPLIVWSEEDAVILPPDDAQGNPFYADPPAQPGLHRDLFKTWARRVAAALLMDGYPMSPAVVRHLGSEYQSESEDSRVPTPRSVSPAIDSSDEEGAHRATSPTDSSDAEGAHLPTLELDSSEEEDLPLEVRWGVLPTPR
jgi:hypothetical protein